MEDVIATPVQLNPFTPMAFLLPDVAFQLMVAKYILVGSCGILIWDVVNNLKADYTLLFRHRIMFPTIVYITSRLAMLAYIIAATIYHTTPMGNCAHFEMILSIFNTIAIPNTSILFFLRVRAIYGGNRLVVAFFGLMWFAILASCFLTTQGVTGAAIGPTSYCIISHMAPYVAVAGVLPLVNDTMIFLAISWRLMRNSLHHSNFKSEARAIIFGDYMPVFSKAVLQEGQKYYLTTVSCGLLAITMLSIKTIPVTYRTMFMVPNYVLMNIMACRVYRKTKLAPFPENGMSSVDVPSTLPLSFVAQSPDV